MVFSTHLLNEVDHGHFVPWHTMIWPFSEVVVSDNQWFRSLFISLQMATKYGHKEMSIIQYEMPDPFTHIDK